MEAPAVTGDRLSREIGPKGYDPRNSVDRDTSSALEWRWAVYTPGQAPVVSFDARMPSVKPDPGMVYRVAVRDPRDRLWIEREMRQLPKP